MASEYQKMKAVHYEGPFSVSVREIEIPKIQHPDDVIIKVTTSGMLIDRNYQVSESSRMHTLMVTG